MGALIPTETPVDNLAEVCNMGWSQWPPALIRLCGFQTAPPVSNPQFTNFPTLSPTVTNNGATPTDPPNNGPLTAYPTTSGGQTGLTPSPTFPGTAAPTQPTTGYPTDVNGFRAPTFPTTLPPTSPGKAAAPSVNGDGGGNDGDTKEEDEGTIGGLDETVFWILLILILVFILCFCCVCCAYFYHQKRVR